MPTKVTAIYDNPTGPAAFEATWADGVLDLARNVPGPQRIESAKVWPKEDGSATPAYRILAMYFADYDAASAAVATPEAGALFETLTLLGSDGVKFIFFDIEPT